MNLLLFLLTGKIDLKMNRENDLMKPRYKVINDYPGRRETMPVGHILTLDKWGAGKWWHEFSEDEPIHIDEGSIKYPAILKPLQWWEERKPEEMPEYIILSKDARGLYDLERFGQVWKKGGIHKVMRWFGTSPFLTKSEFVLACFVEPATEGEYLKYLKTKTP